MTKKLTILVLIFLISPVGFGAGSDRRNLLRDGFFLEGIDGKVSGPDSNDIWLLELASDIADDKAVVKKGTSLQLLPSSTLEKIIADINDRSDETYQLWGRITKYKGRIFIFPTIFLPLSKIKEPETQTSQLKTVTPQRPPQPKSEPNETPSVEKDEWEPIINEPNDILAVPQEILKKLDARRTETFKRPTIETVKHPDVQPSPQRAGRTFQQDTVIVNRTGFILSRALSDSSLAEKNMQFGFIFDSLGRNIPKESIRLLPCEALERAEQRQSAKLEDLQFKIAGIVTSYKGQNYLLLEKATQVYSYGNFAR